MDDTPTIDVMWNFCAVFLFMCIFVYKNVGVRVFYCAVNYCPHNFLFLRYVTTLTSHTLTTHTLHTPTPPFTPTHLTTFTPSLPHISPHSLLTHTHTS